MVACSATIIRTMQRESLTIRFPPELLAQAKSLKVDQESFNDLVVSALQGEVSRRQAISAHQRITQRRRSIQKRTGIQPNSTPDIRELREGDRHHD